MLLKGYYGDKINIWATPSDFDIELNFFNKEYQESDKFLPIEFLRGKHFKIELQCLQCKRSMIIEFDMSNVVWGVKAFTSYCDFGSLTEVYHTKKFIQNILKYFNLIGNEAHGNIYFYRATFKKSYESPRLLFQNCPHCNAQYLATFAYICGHFPERQYSATPDKFYLEEIAWVEFDEEEFFRLANEK